MESLFPDQGWNVCPLHWKCSVKYWTVREVPKTFCIHVFVGFPGKPVVKFCLPMQEMPET